MHFFIIFVTPLKPLCATSLKKECIFIFILYLNNLKGPLVNETYGEYQDSR